MADMRGGFAFSVAAHAIILALLIFGLPYFRPKHEEQPPMISVELVTIGKETTTNKISPVNKVKEKVEEETPAPPTPPPPDSKPTPQPVPDAQPQPQPEAQPSPPVAKPDVAPQEPKAAPPVQKMDFAPTPTLPDIDMKVAALTPPAKVDFKKTPPKPPAPAFNVDAILKNLTKDKPQQPTNQPPQPTAKTTPKQASGAQAPLSASLTASEMDALKQQLARCWSLPAGAKDAQDLVVDIDITVNPDRTVSSAQIVDQGRAASDATFRAAAMSATRALRMPDCTPLALPPDKYNEWQSMTIRFDPKEMLGQ